ncbi:hypothetical protein N7537_002857 [Penicillium hordei]|uniref:Uncharacterized protein n=1 Tax=Penicillium hordei TaxID=40994 RepID=A0AAD6H832_9EURO|nr:uncharacterized protein N7537_002857 [Penicillium hordei]KAJ5617743.1 hypothetical protein N7537_002857 [Penicillium hordei]
MQNSLLLSSVRMRRETLIGVFVESTGGRHTGHLYNLLGSTYGEPSNYLGSNASGGPKCLKGGTFPATMPILEMETSSWDVGEEADVITWLPQFNPANTGWPMRNMIYEFTERSDTPRRASPISMS